MSSDPTRIRRLADRGVANREKIYAILDEGFVCHVAYVIDDRPVVIPTLYARDGDTLLLHGSTGAGMIRAVKRGSPLSVAVTHVDGLVVARTGFHSSANYRSVVAHGHGRLLSGEELIRALDVVVQVLIPGRPADMRTPSEEEIRQTAVISLDLDQVSAKVRTGPPIDDEEDIGTGVWAGVVPLELVPGEPIPAPDLEADVSVPDYLRPYKR